MVAYRADIMEDLKRSEEMTAYQQAQAIYQEFVQRIRGEEEQRNLERMRALLGRLLTRRFGDVSEAGNDRWCAPWLRLRSRARMLDPRRAGAPGKPPETRHRGPGRAGGEVRPRASNYCERESAYGVILPVHVGMENDGPEQWR
jgi:hypothetical protein